MENAREGDVTRRGFARSAAVAGAFFAGGVMMESTGAADAAGGAGVVGTPRERETMLDARDFGARGDGETNDTAALQAALDKAGEVGGAVFVAPGTYLCSDLQMRERTALVGVPAYSYRKPGGTVLKLADAKARWLINITGAVGATLDGLCLFGERLGEGVVGILLDKPDFGREEDAFRIERCLVSRFTGDGIALGRVWCFSVRHSMSAYNGGHGLSIRGWDGFVLDNWFSGNTGAGIAATTDEHASTTITGNRIEWNRAGGIVLYGASTYNITGNYIDRSGGPGIVLSSTGRADNPCQYVTVTGNVINRSGKWAKAGTHDSCQMRLEGLRGVSVTCNTMAVGRDDNGRGEWSPSFGIVYNDVADSVIKDNVMYRGAIERLMVDLGGIAESAIVADNPGSLFEPPAPAAQG